MNQHPTIAELRARVQKGRHREIGNVLARFWARPTAIYGTWLAVRWGLTANQVTAAALGANLVAAAAIGTGTRAGFVAGVALLYLGFWLDHVDGQVARWRDSASLDGVYLDYILHDATNLALGFSLGFGLLLNQGAISWTAAGFAIAAGWTLLALHNDCRYKAFFQRLKSTTQTYRVAGGSGGAPAPPAPWPQTGWGRAAWPVYKSCEPHVVILTLTLIAVFAVVSAWWWRILWIGYVVLMAGLAPLAAALRVARTVRGGAVESEFATWFQAMDAPTVSPVKSPETRLPDAAPEPAP